LEDISDDSCTEDSYAGEEEEDSDLEGFVDADEVSEADMSSTPA
jgi:hypothetical protein